MRAFVVEDSALVRRLVRANLEPMGFEVSEASNGEQALVLILKEGPPELVVLDWNMPVMDGHEFLTRMRGRAETARTRVLMLSARNDQASMAAALEAGADEYMMKPFQPTQLRERVQAILGLDLDQS